MSERRQFFPLSGLLRRAVAGGSAALMLLLVTLSASPGLHERFHGTIKVESENACAVALFSAGVTLTGETIAVELLEIAWTVATPPTTEEIFLVASRYLRQPERGPPGC